MISIQYSKFYKKKNEHTEEEEEDDDNPNGNDKKEFVFLCVDCRVQKSVGMTQQPPPTSIWRSIAGGGATAAKQKGRCTTSQHIPPAVWTYWVTIYAVVVVAEIYSFFFQVTCTIPNGWTVSP